MKTARHAVFAATLAGLILAGCSQDKEAPADTESTIATETAVPGDTLDFSKYGDRADDAREIHKNVLDVIERLRYQDRTGLYENEFAYFREEKNYDDYIAHGEVNYASADSLDHVSIDDIEFFESDSALVNAVFHITKADGTIVPEPIRWVVYDHEGRWIKPYMSRIKFQQEYDDLIRQSEEDM